MTKSFMIEHKDRVVSFLFLCTLTVLYILGDDTAKGPYLYIGFGLIGIYAFLMARNGHRFRVTTENVCMILFVLYAFISQTWAINAALSVSMARTLFILAGVGWLVLNIFSYKRNAHIMIKLFAWAGLLTCVVCIMTYGIQGLVNNMLYGGRIGRAMFGMNANSLGLNCGLTTMALLFLYLTERKVGWMLAPVLPLFIALGTGSRKVLVYIGAGILVLAFLYQWVNNRQKFAALVKFIVIGLLAILFLYGLLQLPVFSVISDRFSTLIGKYSGTGVIDDSTQARDILVETGLAQFRETPILGIGIANAKVIPSSVFYGSYMHNNYVELLAAGGIVGFSIYYSVYLILLVKHIRRLNKKDPILIFSLTTLVLQLIMDWGYVSYFDKKMIFLFAFWIAVSRGWYPQDNRYATVYDRSTI